MSDFQLKLISVPVVTRDIVYFNVEIDRRRCATVPPDIEARLQHLETEGIAISYDDLTTLCASFYQGVPDPMQHATDEGDEAQRDRVERLSINQAHVDLTYHTLSFWNPRSVLNASSGRSKLVITKHDNPRELAHISEILAVGVGLMVAAQIYERPQQLWFNAGLSRFDFRTARPDGGEIRLEVRGRFRRGGWREAVKEVHDKFQTPDFAQAIGVIFAPTDTPDLREPEILVLDPVGEVMQTTTAELRAVLKHYIPFFESQNLQRAAQRLQELALLNEDNFALYLEHGDAELCSLGKSIAGLHRVAFTFGGAQFKGTAWDSKATPWPAALARMEVQPGQGYFYWGVWEKALEALQMGRLQDLVAMKVQSQTSKVGNMVFILMEDATAFAWAPTLAELKTYMFANQPVGAAAG